MTKERTLDLGPADLAEGEIRGYEDSGIYVLVVKLGGKYKALDDVCNHAGCLLSGGYLDSTKTHIVCPCHEVGFDLETGKNVTSPGICDDQPVFPISIVDGRLIVQGKDPF